MFHIGPNPVLHVNKFHVLAPSSISSFCCWSSYSTGVSSEGMISISDFDSVGSAPSDGPAECEMVDEGNDLSRARDAMDEDGVWKEADDGDSGVLEDAGEVEDDESDA